MIQLKKHLYYIFFEPPTRTGIQKNQKEFLYPVTRYKEEKVQGCILEHLPWRVSYDTFLQPGGRPVTLCLNAMKNAFGKYIEKSCLRHLQS